MDANPAPATMRVVRVIARLNVGGPAQHAINLSVGIDERFHTVLAYGDVAEGEADMSDEATRRGATVRRIPGLGRRIHLLDDLTALVHLYRLMREVRPQIVHTHTAKAGGLGRIAAILARVPVRVHTFHGHVFRGYFGRWTTRLFLWIERILARWTSVVIAISDSQKAELVEEFRICEPDRVRVIHLGLELGRFADHGASMREGFRSEIEADDRTVVSIVGRLAPIKNHDLFLDAAVELERAGRRCLFVIVGGGSEGARLRRRAQELGIAEYVRFLGWRSDMERVYAGSDIIALTSDNEGTPVCLIEALAAGRPIVATDVGGVRDVLDEGRLGVLIPPGDPAALAAATAELIDDPEAARDLGWRGRGVARSRFGADRLVRDIERLYTILAPPAPEGDLRTRLSTSGRK